ncbi:hypothetical protein LFT48_22000 (plasmid) [Arthrobacter sp. FW305-123]|nr:hypothetical protein LFT48_22000 [Arthrobacter sp. FW305-123]
MTILDDAVDVLAGNADNTSSAIRKLLVVGTRMQYEPIVEWCKKELAGYAEDLFDDYPAYRRELATLVIVRWTGYGGSIYDHPLDKTLVPSELRGMFNYSYSEPIDELEALTDGGERFWPLPLVQRLRVLAKERKVPLVEDCQIYSVKQILTSVQIKGVISAIRNRALMMALDLQQTFPSAGERNGPTVEDEEVREAVTHIYNTYINGGTNAVAMGEGNTQTFKSQVPPALDAPS